MKKRLGQLVIVIILAVAAGGVGRGVWNYLAPSKQLTTKSADASRTYTHLLPQEGISFTYPDNWSYDSLTASSGHADKTDHVILTAPNGLCILFGSVVPAPPTSVEKLGPLVVLGSDRILEYDGKGMIIAGTNPAIAIYPRCTATAADQSITTPLNNLQQNKYYGAALEVIASMKR